MSSLETLNIEYLKLDSLVPYARNSRTHSDEQVAGIMGSIKQFGFTNPILLGKDNVLIAGHGRLLAAQRLGMKTVPTIRLDHLDEHQQRALVIADNKLALNAGWDEEMLRAEIDAIADLSPELLDFTGFDDAELDELMQWAELDETDDNSSSVASSDSDTQVPDVEEKAISQLGELWLLGKHRLLVGSATDAANYPFLLDGEQAAMCFTDPPYNIDYTGKTDKKLKIKNDKLGGAFHHFLFMSCQQILRHTEGGVYICMSSSELHTLASAFMAAGGKWSTFIIWMKNHFTMGRADYQRQYESILYGWRQNGERHWCGDRNQTDIWQYDRPQKNDLHPTMKPVALVQRAIENSSKPGDLILDPFGGSGTTLIAAEHSQRRAALMELDPIYADVIIRRWQQEAGQQAARSDDGQLFNGLSVAA